MGAPNLGTTLVSGHAATFSLLRFTGGCWVEA